MITYLILFILRLAPTGDSFDRAAYHVPCTCRYTELSYLTLSKCKSHLGVHSINYAIVEEETD